ncbi:PilZ domain-containing protein [Alteromonas gilva]|uniref:Flagellar brake domain-containing protein n=1 Tax=Alteromonas gilva TaxID=2987522 RepID=A0ABT5L1S8_9ALTE|nr:PilZ domain-containing protein [Alteromonas gilva]MDC8830982.1 flagellar brake domain-containing protein [Alteromonas gilva]
MSKQKNTQLSRADIQSLQALSPGSVVDLQISTPTAPKRVRTHYIGADFPHCLLFQLPSESKWGYLRDILVPEKEVVVRYVLEGGEGKVIALRSKVLKVITHPTNIVFIAMPSSLQTLALRKHKRWTPGIQARILIKDNNRELSTECMIVDVSQQGCRCVVEPSPDFPPLDNGKTVSLAISADSDTQIRGIIKNSSSAHAKMFYGVQFSADAEIVKKLLDRFIVEI